MKTVTVDAIHRLSTEAAAAPRRRKNLNLHSSPDDPVQRLLNALEPGSYVRPHRHVRPAKPETMTILAGRAVLLVFDDDGVVQERIALDCTTPVVEVPAAVWHTLAALESGTVLLEVKAGPYVPAVPEDFAGWAPAEGTEPALALERWFHIAHVGERAPR